jgi:hypothetical protein
MAPNSSHTPVDYPATSSGNVTGTGTRTYEIGAYTFASNVASVKLYCSIYMPTSATVARFDDGFVNVGTPI